MTKIPYLSIVDSLTQFVLSSVALKRPEGKYPGDEETTMA
jgi:hypothetical protein